MKRFALAMVMSWFIVSPALAEDPPAAVQPAGGVRAWQMPAGSANWMQTAINWLYSDQVQKELGITDEQKARIDAIRKEQGEAMKNLWKEVSELPAEERGKKYQEAAAELTKAAAAKTREVLERSQMRRLYQIVLQTQVRSAWSLPAIAENPFVARRLELTDEQKEKLVAVQREALAEMQKKMMEVSQQLQNEAREKVLGVLTDEQRAALERLQGEKFEWQWPQRQPAAEQKKE